MPSLFILKNQVHTAFRARFGKDSCAASHVFLRRVTGKTHVGACTGKELKLVLSKCANIKKVRNSVWKKLEQERRSKP